MGSSHPSVSPRRQGWWEIEWTSEPYSSSGISEGSMASGIHGSMVGVCPSSSVTVDFKWKLPLMGDRKVVDVSGEGVVVVKDREVLLLETMKRKNASLDAFMLLQFFYF